MNSLSWMIYAAEALGNLSIALAMIGIGGTVLAIVGGGFAWFLGAVGDDERIRSSGKKMLRVLKYTLPVALFSCLMPSQRAIYLIAASEAGETVIRNPEMQEVFKDLTTIIKAKVKEQLPKT